MRPDGRALVIEEEHPFGFPGLPAPVKMRTLITDEGRLTLYRGQRVGELYAFNDDPAETRNVYGNADDCDLQARLTDRLARELMALSDVGTASTASA